MKNTRLFRKIMHVDPLLALATFGLLLLGTVMIYSASSITGSERFGDGAFFLKRHLMFLTLGVATMFLTFWVNLRDLRRAALPGLLLTGVLLLLTETHSFGVAAHHARRWLQFGGLTFQPSEIAKPLIVLYAAAYLARKGAVIHDFMKGLLPLLLTVGVLLLMILRQPDFGTVVVIGSTVFLMLFVSRARLTHLGALLSLGMMAGAFLIHSAPYRRQRILAFLDPWNDAQGGGFQLIQSLVAFHRGGISGQGLGDGIQKLLYLPEAHTDFIYSVVAEELGLIGSLVLIALFAILLTRGFQLSRRVRDPFVSTLAIGFTTLLAIQSTMNLAVVMGMVPTKGLTLPLVSYGGTSLVATMAMVGVLMSLSSTISLPGRMARSVAR